MTDDAVVTDYDGEATTSSAPAKKIDWGPTYSPDWQSFAEHCRLMEAGRAAAAQREAEWVQRQWAAADRRQSEEPQPVVAPAELPSSV